MILAIHPQLAERAVFEAVRTNSTAASLYQRQFADCYSHSEKSAREDAFETLHQRWFDELGLRDRIAALAAECSHVREKVARLMLTTASGPKSQTVELFGEPGHYTVAIATTPTFLLDRSAFEYWARHEFLHIDDMLDPDFSFDRFATPGGSTSAAKSLTHDRFAVLWAISVDVRLASRSQTPDDIRERRCNEFTRVFCPRDQPGSVARFESMWARFAEQRPTHAAMLALAVRQALDGEAEDLAESQLPGAACPLCSFPTFDWATRDELCNVSKAVRTDFRNWREDEGACQRCVEVYRAHAASLSRRPAECLLQFELDRATRSRNDVSAICRQFRRAV